MHRHYKQNNSVTVDLLILYMLKINSFIVRKTCASQERPVPLHGPLERLHPQPRNVKGMKHVPNIFMSFVKYLFLEVINILI